jgi:hypothetical protein
MFDLKTLLAKARELHHQEESWEEVKPLLRAWILESLADEQLFLATPHYRFFLSSSLAEELCEHLKAHDGFVWNGAALNALSVCVVGAFKQSLEGAVQKATHEVQTFLASRFVC